ncbi:hypothetical protein [Schlesneria paludicola]|uniref:hypothetical protein n=1 Tax=Schlesneria paludicola TaxID=360056 RepID=UPI00029A238E|nr:hypothetical protein [Schlesneria paludicola]
MMNLLRTRDFGSNLETLPQFKQSAANKSFRSIWGFLTALALAGPALAVDVVDDPAQIDERVTQVMQTTNSLCWEMYNYHQQQPGFKESYQSLKDIWEKSRQVQEALRTGTVETEVLNNKLIEMNDSFIGIQKTLSDWQAGDQTSVATNAEPVLRTVVSPGVGVDIPFIGLRVGGPDVVVTEQPAPVFQRKRLHVNARGSKRSLEREIAAARVAMSYLLEDAGIGEQSDWSATGDRPASAPAPQPPRPDSALKTPSETVPPRVKSSTGGPTQK